MDKLQKEFEEWLESEFGMWAIQARPGVYGSEQIQDMWKAWQAALSANGGEVAKSAPHSDYGYIPSKDHQWFFYDPEGDGMTFCKTEEEAFSGADQAIWQSLDECWSECVDQICYGKIVQAAAQVDRVDRPENVGADGYTPDGVHWPQDCEFMCNYRLESVTHPAPPSVAVPENEIKAQALEWFADWLKRQSFAHKKRWTSAANEALRCAARLRTAGDEGEK